MYNRNHTPKRPKEVNFNKIQNRSHSITQRAVYTSPDILESGYNNAYPSKIRRNQIPRKSQEMPRKRNRATPKRFGGTRARKSATLPRSRTVNQSYGGGRNLGKSPYKKNGNCGRFYSDYKNGSEGRNLEYSEKLNYRGKSNLKERVRVVEVGGYNPYSTKRSSHHSPQKTHYNPYQLNSQPNNFQGKNFQGKNFRGKNFQGKNFQGKNFQRKNSEIWEQWNFSRKLDQAPLTTHYRRKEYYSPPYFLDTREPWSRQLKQEVCDELIRKITILNMQAAQNGLDGRRGQRTMRPMMPTYISNEEDQYFQEMIRRLNNRENGDFGNFRGYKGKNGGFESFAYYGREAG